MPQFMALTPASLATAAPSSKKLLDQVRDVIRLKHYSIRTEQSYTDWIRRYILFHGKRHPAEMAEAEVAAFDSFVTHSLGLSARPSMSELPSLFHSYFTRAREGKVAASTQNQALSALLFLYREVLKQEIGWLDGVERAKKPVRVPVVLTKDEIHRIFAHLQGTARLMAGLLYGSGLRLMECVRLRVKDIDFARACIVVRDGKGAKDRVTMLPLNLVAPIGTAPEADQYSARGRLEGRVRKRLSPVRAGRGSPFSVEDATSSLAWRHAPG
jgi:integrase